MSFTESPTMGVDPFAIPKRMTIPELEWWILFGICVAGKGADQTQKKVNALLQGLEFKYNRRSPFELVRVAENNGSLLDMLKKYKMGQYKRIKRAFVGVIRLDLTRVSIEALESVMGIGPKTARMIMLYYDPQAECVPLDTHILKYLRANGYDAPKSTPSAGKKYLALEQAFQELARKQGKTVRELDTEVWLYYAKGTGAKRG